MTTPAEAHLNGRDNTRRVPQRDKARQAAQETRAEFECVEVPGPRGVRSVPGTATVSICIGSVAVIGGLVIAALARPSAPGTVWLISTLVLACVGGACAAPTLEILERRQARRG